MDPRRSGTRQKGIARRHYYRTRPAIAGADANVRSIGHGPEGPEKYLELRRRPDPLFVAGAGRLAVARPRQHCRSRGSAAQRSALVQIGHGEISPERTKG